jgi:hypothetical protein
LPVVAPFDGNDRVLVRIRAQYDPDCRFLAQVGLMQFIHRL